MHIVEATSSTCPLNSGCADKSLPNSNKNNDEVLKISNDKKPMKQLARCGRTLSNFQRDKRPADELSGWHMRVCL